MNRDDFKKLLDESLEPVKGELKGVKEDLTELKGNLKEVKDTQAEHTEILEERLLPSVVTIETEIKAYADMYKINNSNAKKLEKRIEVLEDQSGIISPPELTLTEVH